MPCGRDCSCCDFGDGTAPVDHKRDCELVQGGWGRDPECTCEGAQERAQERVSEDEENEFPATLHIECSVHSVEKNSFYAIGRDVSKNQIGGEYDLVLEFEDLKPGDAEWVSPGAIFDVWRRDKDGKEYWDISFRKAVWTKEEIAEMKLKGFELFQLFGSKEDKE